MANWANSEATVVFRRVTFLDSSSELASSPPCSGSVSEERTLQIARYGTSSGNSFISSHLSSVIALDIRISPGFTKDMTTGWYCLSNVASFQWIAGSNAMSQGYPRITSSFPRFVSRNRRTLVSAPVRTCRSVKWVIFPSWLCVPSTFQILRGTPSGSDVILSRWSRFLHMKLSVAPESMRTSLSAVACADSNNTGIRMDLYLLLYTLIRSAVAQAVGFRH